MNKEKYREAASLTDVLLAADIHQASGLLTIQHVQEGRTEKGEIYLLAGQLLYARVGKLSGQKALEYLLTWRYIYFSLDPDAPRPPANLASRGATSAYLVPSTRMQPITSHFPTPAAGPVVQPGPERLIPQKIGLEQQTLSSALSHRQRLVYFLVNGQRTIVDVSRCSGKTILEVEEILHELQRMGLVVLSAPE